MERLIVAIDMQLPLNHSAHSILDIDAQHPENADDMVGVCMRDKDMVHITQFNSSFL